MLKPTQCIARNILVISTLALGIACRQNDGSRVDSQRIVTAESNEPESCNFDGAEASPRQAQTVAILVDLSGSMQASATARCNTVGIEATRVLNSLKNQYDLELFVVATGKGAAPQIILDFTHIVAAVEAKTDDPLATGDTIEREEQAIWMKHVNHLKNCVVSMCNKATRANSRMFDLAESTLQQIGVQCKKDPSRCQAVSLLMVSDLADDDVFAKNAKSRAKNATLGFKSINITACGTHQVSGASLVQQRKYEAAWKRLFAPALEILPTCAGTQVTATGRST